MTLADLISDRPRTRPMKRGRGWNAPRSKNVSSAHRGAETSVLTAQLGFVTSYYGALNSYTSSMAGAGVSHATAYAQAVADYYVNSANAAAAANPGNAALAARAAAFSAFASSYVSNITTAAQNAANASTTAQSNANATALANLTTDVTNATNDINAYYDGIVAANATAPAQPTTDANGNPLPTATQTITAQINAAKTQNTTNSASVTGSLTPLTTARQTSNTNTFAASTQNQTNQNTTNNNTNTNTGNQQNAPQQQGAPPANPPGGQQTVQQNNSRFQLANPTPLVPTEQSESSEMEMFVDGPTGGTSARLLGNFLDIFFKEAPEVYDNRRDAGASATDAVVTSIGVTAATLTGVRGVSDMFSEHDAVDGHVQSDLERSVDGWTGGLSLGLTGVSAATKVLKPISVPPPASVRQLEASLADDVVRETSSSIEVIQRNGGKIAETSPIQIPGDAAIRPRAGHEFRYTWRGADGRDYLARFHSPSKGAPPGSSPSWVIERALPGSRQGVRRIAEIYIGDGIWLDKGLWESYVLAYQKGAATEGMKNILRRGHFPVQ